jgi:MFS family permease/DNA-binding transcriptional MerR regulator
VRDVPDRRTIRYYTTLGLIDRPSEMRGRTALYDRRHLLQLVAIKKLQAGGQSLAEVQRALAGQTDRGLAEVARLGGEGLAPGAVPARRPPPARDFWREAPAAHVPAPTPEANRPEPAQPGEILHPQTFHGVPLADGVALLLASSRPIVGPPVGGFITTYASWHWIFFLNVPLGIIGMALSSRIIPNMREDKAKPFDWIGFFLSASACVTFVYGMELVGRQTGQWKPTSIYLVSGVVLGFFSVIHFLRAPAPLLNLSLLKIKTFAITLQGGSLFRIAISVSPFLLPLMFQVGFGLNAFQSGLLMLGLFTGNLMMKSVVTPVLRRFGFRNVLTANGMLNAILTASCALLFPQTARIIILLVLFVNGLSRSMQFTAVGTLAFADIAKPDMSTATSFFSMITQMSMGMGVAVGAIALRLAGYMTGNSLGAPTTKEFHVAFLLVAVLSVFATLDCFILEPDAGAAVSGHQLAKVPEKTSAAT